MAVTDPSVDMPERQHGVAIDESVASGTRPPTVDVASAHHGAGAPKKVLAALVTLIAAYLIYWLAANPRLEWSTVGRYLFAAPVMRGLRTTVEITILVEVLSCVLSVGIALVRLSSFAPGRVLAGVFVWIVRAVPPLVQLIFWFNFAYLAPHLSLGIPFGGPTAFRADTNSVISPYLAGIIGLTLFCSAHMSEVVRAGILSVDRGQRDAAKTLGFRPWTTFTRVILPQAMRVIIPPSGTLLIMLVQGTSLLSAITVGELLLSVQNIYSTNFKPIPLLVVASIWYVVIVSVLSVGQYFLEKRYSQGWAGAASSSPRALRRRWASMRPG